MSNASAVSNTSGVDEPFLGFTTEDEDFNDAWKITLLTELGLLIALVVLCVIYGCCFATSEGKASARARCPTRSRSKRIAPHADPDRVTQEVYDAIHPYFKTRKKNGKLPNLTDGDYHDPDNLDEAGLPKNRLVEGEYHSTQALQLLTRAITMEAMLDKNGIFKKGGDDLQKDPKAAFAQSRPTRRIKAFMSHTWDAVDFDPKRVLQNRAKHADDTTKAIMMHIKFRPLLVVSVACQIVLAMLVAAFPFLGILGLVLLYGLPLWIVGSRNKLLLWFLGLDGDQFWMDKATIHQANLVAGAEPKGIEPVPPTGFKFVPGPMTDEQVTQQTSDLRCLNQAGVGLFDHFLKSSDELWVLFIPRYIERVWCIYELAYWLRLMKQDRRRKIKLIPIERNASLFRGFPKFQALLGGFALLFAVLVLWSTAWFHKGGPYYTELVPFILLFQGTCCFCVGLAVLWYVRKTTILPARAERRRIVNELRSFKVANTKATVGNDKQVVEDMIATMWKPLAKGDKSKEACLQAFDEEVRTEVASSLDGLLRSTERALWRQYVVQLVSVFLCGFFYLFFALDALRPLLAPRFGHWSSNNYETFAGLGVITGLVILVAYLLIYCRVKRHFQ